MQRPAAPVEAPEPRQRPLTSYVVTGEYGRRGDQLHEGIDLAAAEGAPIRCVANGRVLSARWHGRLGNLVEVRHPGGWTSRYAHLKGFSDIRPGQDIEMGTVVGGVGSTGLSTGPHLHFEWLNPYGNPIDPRTHFRF